VFQWTGLLVDALVPLGQLDEAADHVARLEGLASTAPNVSAGAEAAFAAALLLTARGDLRGAEHQFREAAAGDARSVMPFEAALTGLRCGSAWRRMKDLDRAEPWLSSALETFDLLGVMPYADLARRELRAAGLTPKSSGGVADLTGQESVVASLVTKGLSNRQIAAEMVLSPRTVEYHLASIDRKVGVSSRTQLAAALLGAGR
jgi:DNA-binding CsgD family transcriptional regulator